MLDECQTLQEDNNNLAEEAGHIREGGKADEDVELLGYAGYARGADGKRSCGAVIDMCKDGV